MTPFEQEIVRAFGSIADELRLAREGRTRFEKMLSQKLDSAIAHRDEAIKEDLAATNKRLTELEKALRGNGHPIET